MSASREEARSLQPGSDHYTAYVGPPKQYDFMGATQFRLLTSLGLRDHHRVLDLGCGSLRAGRLLIPYLLPQRYFGIEPNTWLVDEALDQELGRDILTIKQPHFDDNCDFRADMFGVEFDFVVAQSIFSHTTSALTTTALGNVASVLAPQGLLVCTFILADEPDVDSFPQGWVYPECVTYSPERVAVLFHDAGLHHIRLPWFHPRQTWFIASTDPQQLPPGDELEFLRGAVLRDPEFRTSLPD